MVQIVPIRGPYGQAPDVFGPIGRPVPLHPTGGGAYVGPGVSIRPGPSYAGNVQITPAQRFGWAPALFAGPPLERGRPPDVQVSGGLTSAAGRARASQEASAYELANRLFNAARQFWGPGAPGRGVNAPMPLVYFHGRTPGQQPLMNLPAGVIAATTPRGQLPDPVARQLGVVAFPHGAQFRTDPEARQAFADILTHELAHTQQPLGIFRRGAMPVPQQQMRIEGGADAFARLVRDYVARRAGIGRPPMPYRSAYAALAAQFLNRFGPQFALRGQFQQ